MATSLFIEIDQDQRMENVGFVYFSCIEILQWTRSLLLLLLLRVNQPYRHVNALRYLFSKIIMLFNTMQIGKSCSLRFIGFEIFWKSPPHYRVYRFFGSSFSAYKRLTRATSRVASSFPEAEYVETVMTVEFSLSATRHFATGVCARTSSRQSKWHIFTYSLRLVTSIWSTSIPWYFPKC